MNINRKSIPFIHVLVISLAVFFAFLVYQRSTWIKSENKNNAAASWKIYVDSEHGFSLEIPSDWQGKPERVEFSEPQNRFVTQTQTLNPCTNASDYIKNNPANFTYHEIELLQNSHLDGFIVKNLHLDNITPGPEAYIINCPYLIRLGLNSSDFPNPDALFQHIVSSMKVWKTPAKSTNSDPVVLMAYDTLFNL